MMNIGINIFICVVRGKAVILKHMFVMWEVVDLCKEYIDEMELFLYLIVVMDDEDGRCLLDVIW